MSATEWPRRKAAALLPSLALDRRLLKEQAIEFLWPEANLASGANNLYSTLHVLRQTLDMALGQGAAEAIFSFEDGVLSLAPSVWVDVQEFERLCTTAPTEPPEQRVANLEQALGLYQGDLLPDDRYAEWTLLPRQALYRRQREARLALAAYRRDARDYAGAMALLGPLLAPGSDPADELVHRELMRLYALAGRRHEALRQYQTCVEALAADLDVPPEPETAALYGQILSGELTSWPGSISSTGRPIPSVALKIEPSPLLVGREAEFERLRGWLDTVRRGRGLTLLITGDAGIGKTLLASELLCAAVGSGMTVLFGAAYEQEGQLVYQPFVESFDRYLAEHQRPPGENPITSFKPRGSSDPQQ